ncbi:Gfo/Idh/MocA family oxidoreductase [Halomonas sp. LY9]
MIRLAIIGAGSMAGEHAKHYGRIEGVEVVAVCDRDFPKAQAFAERHGIADVYQDLDAMLARDDIHAVSNVTPDGVHKVTSLAAIAAGKHILCEKPWPPTPRMPMRWPPPPRPLTSSTWST